jgi:serine/threonine protein phosphatase 1
MSGADPATAGEAPFPAGELPDGLRLYVFGDIHGRFDLLERLSSKVRQDFERSRPPRAVEIYLGDYIDRGPDSRDVIEWLITSPPLAGERICLMGNHEDLLLSALNDLSEMPNWLFNGAAETIGSYLVEEGVAARDFASLEDIRLSFISAFPVSHREFISALRRKIIFGGYFFVHAGIRPGRPLDQQVPDDLIWIREPFLSSDADFGKLVVHGHTPVSRPDIRPNRINIDTGAVFSDCLTCLVLEGSSRRFLDTAG